MQYPFFCKDREYILGRRIWESNNTYYCITQVRISKFLWIDLWNPCLPKWYTAWYDGNAQIGLKVLMTCLLQGVPYPAVPPQHAPRRVDIFFSSWRIRASKSLEDLLVRQSIYWQLSCLVCGVHQMIAEARNSAHCKLWLFSRAHFLWWCLTCESSWISQERWTTHSLWSNAIPPWRDGNSAWPCQARCAPGDVLRKSSQVSESIKLPRDKNLFPNVQWWHTLPVRSQLLY